MNVTLSTDIAGYIKILKDPFKDPYKDPFMKKFR